MWPSQIVYSLCVCSFVARAINSNHTQGQVGVGFLGGAGAASPEPGKTARPTDELALFFQPTEFAASLSLSLVASFGWQLRRHGRLTPGRPNKSHSHSQLPAPRLASHSLVVGGTKNRFVCFR